MSDPLPSLFEFSQEESEMKPWEQRSAPGLGGGGTPLERPQVPVDALPQFCQQLEPDGLMTVIEQQTDLVHFPMVAHHTTPTTDLSVKVTSNAEVWRLFLEERLYDTRRVTLEHFHLFEWFPLSPGRFHTPEGRQYREMASQSMELSADGRTYFNPVGKLAMIRGGIGAVRLRPRQIADEPHFFMTASSTAVCHEGFPVLIPRRFYGPLKARMLGEGAVPVTLSGEMRYIPPDAVTFFAASRDIPLLYLHVDDLQVLPRPRSEVTSYLVSAAVSFAGRFEGREGLYVTFASFDPASQEKARQAVTWLEQSYVSEMHGGVVVTDFDEMVPRFPHAVFGLPDLMAGKLSQPRVKAFLESQGLGAAAGQPFCLVYKEINTQGGAYIEGDVSTGGGDFIGRDQITAGSG